MSADYDLTNIVPALRRDGWPDHKIARELNITQSETRTRTCRKQDCTNVVPAGDRGQYCRNCRPETTDQR